MNIHRNMYMRMAVYVLLRKEDNHESSKKGSR